MQKIRMNFFIFLMMLFFSYGIMAGCTVGKPAVKETVTVGSDEEVIVVPKDRDIFIPGEKVLELPGEGEGKGTLIQQKK